MDQSTGRKGAAITNVAISFYLFCNKKNHLMKKKAFYAQVYYK